MGFSTSAGGSAAIASAYGSSINMSAVTNATEAVATLAAAHGVVVGDILEITSGWERLNNRIVRVKTVSTNDVTLEGINTTSTTSYPAGQGGGTVRKITTWVSLQQVGVMNFTGGEQQFADITGVFDRTQRQIPTTRTPLVAEINLHDDLTLAFYATIRAAEEAGNPVALRVTDGNGARALLNGYWSMSQFATRAAGETKKRSVTFTAVAEATEYAT